MNIKEVNEQIAAHHESIADCKELISKLSDRKEIDALEEVVKSIEKIIKRKEGILVDASVESIYGN